MKRWSKTALLAAVAGFCALAGTAVPTDAEIHNGGVDCTDWNGVYHLGGASAKDRALLPPSKDTISITQDRPNGVNLEVTIGGERVKIDAHTNDSKNRRTMMIKGVPTQVYGSWIDGYGKNWTVILTPDPMRPNVRHSIREFLLTSFHTVVVQATVRDPKNQVPLATFPATSKRIGGSKIKDIVDARAVYMMNVGEQSSAATQLRGTGSR